MSKIKNDGLDQYGKVWSLNGIGGERVNIVDPCALAWSANWWRLYDRSESYLHHKDESVERNHGHDEVVERLRNDQLPDAVLERKSVLGHVATRRSRINRKVNALLLQVDTIRYMTIFVRPKTDAHSPKKLKNNDTKTKNRNRWAEDIRNR